MQFSHNLPRHGSRLQPEGKPRVNIETSVTGGEKREKGGKDIKNRESVRGNRHKLFRRCKRLQVVFRVLTIFVKGAVWACWRRKSAASRSAVDVDLRMWWSQETRAALRNPICPLRDVTWPVKSRGADPDKEHTLKLTHSSWVSDRVKLLEVTESILQYTACYYSMLVRMQSNRILLLAKW